MTRSKKKKNPKITVTLLEEASADIRVTGPGPAWCRLNVERYPNHGHQQTLFHEGTARLSNWPDLFTEATHHLSGLTILVLTPRGKRLVANAIKTARANQNVY